MQLRNRYRPLLLVAMLAGCGEGSGPSLFEVAASPAAEDVAAGGASAATLDGVPMADASQQSDPDAAVVAEGVPIVGPSKHGVIAVSQVDATDLAPSPTLYAAFQEAPVTWQGCTRYDVAECYFYECPEGANPVHGILDSGYPAASAGALSVSVGGAESALEQQGSGLYQASVSERLWAQPGTTLLATALGADVPAFQLGVPTPSAVEVTSPASSPLDPIHVQRSTHFPIAWTPATSGTVRVAIYNREYRGLRPGLFCNFPTQWGGGVIPSAALSEMEATGPYAFRVAGTAEAKLTVEEWDLVLSVSAFADANSGEVNSMLWLDE